MRPTNGEMNVAFAFAASRAWVGEKQSVTFVLMGALLAFSTLTALMPSGMSGGELARILQMRSPGLKVIYTSGYSPEILKKDSLLAQGINFLPKPYDPQTLLKSVRTCLDGGRLTQNEMREMQPVSGVSIK